MFAPAPGRRGTACLPPTRPNHVCRSRTCPAKQGLYDPAAEADSCGVAFLADLQGRPSHKLVRNALIALHNMDHRGAAGAEPSSGDGSGLTVALPDEFLRAVLDFELPALGGYATGIAFLPTDAAAPGTGRTAAGRDRGR